MADRQSMFWKIQRGELPYPPAAQTLGCSIPEVDPDAGTITVEFEANEQMLNPAGKIQGGFLAAMLDDTMGPCIVATLAAGEFAPTLNLNVSFHTPASPGRITGTARVTHRGGRVFNAVGELRQDGRLLATGQATALMVKGSH